MTTRFRSGWHVFLLLLFLAGLLFIAAGEARAAPASRPLSAKLQWLNVAVHADSYLTIWRVSRAGLARPRRASCHGSIDGREYCLVPELLLKRIAESKIRNMEIDRTSIPD